MILKKLPMEIVGTLKGITPEDAKRLFDFDLPEGAKGITFTRRGKQIVMKAYYPERYKNKGPEQDRTNEYMKIINKIGHLYLEDIIRPIWDEPARKKKYYSGFNMFASVNLKLIREGIENLVVSIGELESPKIKYISYKNDELKFSVDKENCELGIGILNPRIMSFKHIKPMIYKSKVVCLRLRAEKVILFLYYKEGEKYSMSVGKTVSSEQ